MRRIIALIALALATPAAAQQLPDYDAQGIALQAKTAAAAAPKLVTGITVDGNAGGYKTLVVSDVPGTTYANNSMYSTGIPVFQINGTDANATGLGIFKWGADPKGAYNVVTKTRGVTMNDYAAVQSGDRLTTFAVQAGTGSMGGHAGTEVWSVDGSVLSGGGEANARWTLGTGTGIQSSQASTTYPNRYGVMTAIVANSFQQVYFPGGTTNQAGFAAGANFGGYVVIGPGAATPGFGALKFQVAGAALLATPEVGAFEVDANAKPYFTSSDGVRRVVVMADASAPTIAYDTGVIGTGGTATIVSSAGSSGKISVTTGTSSSTSGGSIATITYAHAFAVDSYPVVTGSNKAAAALTSISVRPSATGFILATGSLADSTTYTFSYYAPGK